MFDVKGSITVTTIKPSKTLTNKVKNFVEGEVNKANKTVQIKVETNAAEVKKSLSDIKESLNGVTKPVQEATKKAKEATTELNKGLKDVKKSSDGANSSLSKTDNIFDKLSKQATNMLTFTIVAGVFFQVTRAINSTIESIIRFQKDIINVTKVMNVTTEETVQLQDAVKNLGQTFGFSLGEAANAAAVYAQQGKSMNEVIRLTEASLLLANTSILTTTESTEALTAILNQFGFSANEVVRVIDSLNEVANKYAVTEADITEAIKRSGAAAEEAGVSFEKFAGFVAALQERTRRGGRVIGTALKTIFARLNTDKAVKALREVGIESFNLEGNFTNLSDRIDNIAAIWENLTNVQRVNLATAIAGKRRYSDFLSLMSGYDTVLNATQTATESQNSAMIENEKIMGTLDKTIKSLKTTWDAFVVSLGDAGVGSAIGIVAKGFESIAKALSLIPPELIATLLGAGIVTGGAKIIGSLSGQLGDFVRGRRGEAGAGVRGGSAGFLEKTVNKAGKALDKFGDKILRATFKIDEGIQAVTGSGRFRLLRRSRVGAAIGEGSGRLFAAGAVASTGAAVADRAGFEGVGEGLSTVASAANIAAFTQLLGITKKIGGAIGIAAGSVAALVGSFAAIAISAVSIYNTLDDVGFRLDGISLKGLKKDFDDFKSSQKEIRVGFEQIRKSAEEGFSIQNAEKQLKIFKQLVEKQPELARYENTFEEIAFGTGDLDKELKKIIEDLQLIEKNKALNIAEASRRRLSDEFSGFINKLQVSALGDLTDSQKVRIEELARSASLSFSNEISNINVRAKDATALLNKAGNQAVDTLVKYVDKIGVAAVSDDARDFIGKLLEDSLFEEINKVRKKIAAVKLEEEANKVGQAISKYEDAIFSVTNAIDQSEKAHKKYDEFIKDTANVLGELDFSAKIEESEKRIKESQKRLDDIFKAGIIDKNLLEPFVLQAKNLQARVKDVSQVFGGAEAQKIVREFAGSAVSAEGSFGQIVGLILQSSIEGGIDLQKFKTDKSYSQRIADKISEEFGEEFTIDKVRSVLNNFAIGFGDTFGKGIEGTIKRLETELKKSGAAEKDLNTIRENSITILEALVNKNKEINDSYNRLINDSKDVLSVNNKILDIRNRVITLEFGNERKRQALSKIRQNTERNTFKNLSEIDNIQKRINEQTKVRRDSLEDLRTQGREENFSRETNALNRDARKQEIELYKLRASEQEKLYKTITDQISFVNSEADKFRAQSEKRFLTTTDESARQRIDLGFIKSIIGDPTRTADGQFQFRGGQATREKFFAATATTDRERLLKSLTSREATGDKEAAAIRKFLFGSDKLESERQSLIDDAKKVNERIADLYENINTATLKNIGNEETNIKNFSLAVDKFNTVINNSITTLDNYSKELLKKQTGDATLQDVSTPFDNKNIAPANKVSGDGYTIEAVNKLVAGVEVLSKSLENSPMVKEINSNSKAEIKITADNSFAKEAAQIIIDQKSQVQDIANKQIEGKIKAQKSAEDMFGPDFYSDNLMP